MVARKHTILAGPPAIRGAGFAGALAAACLLAAAVFEACSSAPVKMECQEIQARIDYGDLSGDQLRFAQQELDECKGRVKAADARDSAFIEGTEKRFTPSDSQ